MKDLKGNIVFIEQIKFSDELRFYDDVRVYQIKLKINGLKLSWNSNSKIKNLSVFTNTIVKFLKNMDTYNYFGLDKNKCHQSK